MTALSVFSFKTCLRFTPAMSHPGDTDHVLLFANPDGKRRCALKTEGHSVFEPHLVTLGYDCLKSPYIEMVIMKSLGFPFEHNRPNRNLYVDILVENIQPEALELFTKDISLPVELRNLPYDYNSVMHFGARENSKNGHRTILFKDPKRTQNRVGLSEIDLRKIEVVYGPECLKRDRQAKIDLCQSYPGVARRKRDVRISESLRINPDITPFPKNLNISENDEINSTIIDDDLKSTLDKLEITDEMEILIEEIHTVIDMAVSRAKTRHCNGTTKHNSVPKINVTNTDLSGAVEIITNLVISNVENALTRKDFCTSKDIPIARCGYGSDDRCRQTYRSTKSGAVKYSTQHRPTYYQSTNHYPLSRIKHLLRSQGDKNTTDAKGSDSISDVNVEAKKDRVRKKRSLDGDVEEDSVRKSEKGSEEPGNLSSNHVTEALDAALKNGTGGRMFFKARHYSVKSKNQMSNINWEDSNLSLETNRKISTKKNDREYSRNVFTEMTEVYTEKQTKKRLRQQKQKEKSGSRFAPKTVRLTKLNKEFYEDRKWPSGVVRYVIKDNAQYDVPGLRRRLEEVNEILMEKTCVRIRELSEDEVGKYKDYLVIDDSPDYVTGRVGGRQNFGSIELLRGGQHRQHTAMMVMAMLGFYFEVARHDRDLYIKVHPRHIRPDKLHHFEKIRPDATFDLAYDYKSATHPAWQYWRQIGRTGISSVATYKDQDPDGSIMRSLGQNEELLSDIDIIKINSVYGVKCFRNQN
ncbi:uncharacterized protein LOC101745063 isoform X3 [Bombyx mori]